MDRADLTLQPHPHVNGKVCGPRLTSYTKHGLGTNRAPIVLFASSY
jgi:hypothetical protein